MKFSDYSDIEEIIIHSLTGIASKEELKKLKYWRELSSENDLSYQLLRKIWVQKSPEPLHPDYQSLEKRIMDAGFSENLNIPSPVIRRRSLFYKLAAVITFICLVSWSVLKIIPGKVIVETTEELVVTYNPTGQKSKITLPDNSVIWLNSESSLSYQKGFSDSVRYIELEGEAYFEVEPDTERPFIVETGGISTMALGTSFNIRNFPEECSISISLLSGMVRVTDSQASNEVLLEPFEQVKIMKERRTLKMTKLETDHVSIWKDGIIHFKRSSFSNVIKTLQRSYDVVIDTVDYKTTDWSYTGKFDNMSLEIVLTRIGYSEGFGFEIDGRNIRIFNERE